MERRKTIETITQLLKQMWAADILPPTIFLFKPCVKYLNAFNRHFVTIKGVQVFGCPSLFLYFALKGFVQMTPLKILPLLAASGGSSGERALGGFAPNPHLHKTY
jgi:hypothetical protein